MCCLKCSVSDEYERKGSEHEHEDEDENEDVKESLAGVGGSFFNCNVPLP